MSKITMILLAISLIATISPALAADCGAAKTALASASTPDGFAKAIEAVAGKKEATKFLAVYGKDGDGAKKVAEQVVASCK